jgi:hypothetical protein
MELRRRVSPHSPCRVLHLQEVVRFPTSFAGLKSLTILHENDIIQAKSVLFLVEAGN